MSDTKPVEQPTTTQDSAMQIEDSERREVDIKKVLTPEVLDI